MFHFMSGKMAGLINTVLFSVISGHYLSHWPSYHKQAQTEKKIYLVSHNWTKLSRLKILPFSPILWWSQIISLSFSLNSIQKSLLQPPSYIYCHICIKSSSFNNLYLIQLNLTSNKSPANHLVTNYNLAWLLSMICI